MKVGVLGSGDVAKALGRGFLEHGHDVMLGTRDATKLTDWAEQKAEARVGSFADAADHGELVILAVKGSACAAMTKTRRGSFTVSWSSSAGSQRTWAGRKPPARSSPCASSGAFPASCETNGITRSRC